ncbi:MAG: Fe-S cluster assembly protein SufD [Porphyromonas sp.]|nr:Fe-S cluster assembly protein SufD [Porphyromonas sp.]
MNILDKLCSLAAAPNAQAKAALERFRTLGLPAFRSEEYQRTDLHAMLDEAWEYGTAEYSDNREELTWPAGSTIDKLPSVASPSALTEQLDRDPLAQLCLGLNQETLLIHLPKGAKLEKALELESFLMANGRVLEARRTVIILEEDAELEVVVRERNVGEHCSMSLQSLEIVLGAGAKLRYTDLEQTSALSRRISTLHIRQEAGSDANICFFSLHNGKTRNNYYCDLAGEGANLSLGGFVVNSGKEHTDNFSFISHSVPHCTSNELFKYALQDDSYGVFTGRILVAIDAQKTQAYQTNNNLLLSKTAKMQAKPQLEIYADDVKCSHGMTTGQLNEQAIFYMQQRGIAKAEAKRLLSIAFSEDTLQLVENEELRDLIREEITARFA